jgi:hypothetical protein
MDDDNAMTLFCASTSMISALIRRSLRSPLAFAVVGSATSITAYAAAPTKCEPKETLVGMRCNYWAGRGLMEVPRFCLAIAGKEYEDWRLQGDYDATKGMGHALDANLGRLPTIDCVDGTIGQSAAINFYIASECGLMGSSTFEAAKIIEFGEHLKELHMAFRKLVPYGSEPKAEALATVLSGRARANGGVTRVVAGDERDFDCNGPSCEAFHAFVNCTPLGMEGGPDPKGSAMPDDAFLDDSVVVMDTVYAPKDTPFLREARARGALAVDGEAMFLKQAELQSELFRARW